MAPRGPRTVPFRSAKPFTLEPAGPGVRPTCLVEAHTQESKLVKINL
jgi:hypothetical protein